jgi:hypothetical protein
VFMGSTTYFAINQWQIYNLLRSDHISLEDGENEKLRAATDRQIRSPKKL